MSESKLMSYITSDFASKSDMRVGAEEWQAIIEEMLPKFKKSWRYQTNCKSDLE